MIPCPAVLSLSTTVHVATFDYDSKCNDLGHVLLCCPFPLQSTWQPSTMIVQQNGLGHVLL